MAMTINSTTLLYEDLSVGEIVELRGLLNNVSNRVPSCDHRLVEPWIKAYVVNLQDAWKTISISPPSISAISFVELMDPIDYIDLMNTKWALKVAQSIINALDKIA